MSALERIWSRRLVTAAATAAFLIFCFVFTGGGGANGANGANSVFCIPESSDADEDDEDALLLAGPLKKWAGEDGVRDLHGIYFLFLFCYQSRGRVFFFKLFCKYLQAFKQQAATTRLYYQSQ